jgi:hypothetical protein
MCSILCWTLSIWEALGWIFLAFWLDSCIVNKGEKFDLEMACYTHLEGFQVVSSYFLALAVSQVASAWPVKGTGLAGVVPRCWAILSTGLTGEGDRSDWLELSWCSCSVFIKWFACIHPGGVALVQGELAYVQGELFVVFELWLVIFALCLSMVLSRMCWAVALA